MVEIGTTRSQIIQANRSWWRRCLTLRWEDINHRPIILLTRFQQAELLLPTDARLTSILKNSKATRSDWRPGPCHVQRVGSFTYSSLACHEPDHRSSKDPQFRSRINSPGRSRDRKPSGTSVVL